jgi:hypothetical protein
LVEQASGTLQLHPIVEIPLFSKMEISARWTPDWKRGGRCGRYGG